MLNGTYARSTYDNFPTYLTTINREIIIMNIILNQPNHTSTAKVLILEASKDIVTSDPLNPLALTKVITQDKTEHKFWSRDNKPLGSAGDSC